MCRKYLIGLSLLALLFGSLESIDAQSLTFSVGTANHSYNPAVGVTSHQSSVSIFILEDSPGTTATDGFTMGCAHDPSLLSIQSVDLAGALLSLRAGAGPEFENRSIHADGWTFGVVYSFGVDSPLVFGTETEVLQVTYSAVEGILAGVFDENTTTPLQFVNTIGTPATANLVVIAAQGFIPELSDGAIVFQPPTFMRGDTSSNLIIDLGDVVFILNYLFPGQGPGSSVVEQNCLDSSDVDDSGAIDIADAVNLLQYLFLGGTPPAEPFDPAGQCGLDPTPDDLDCTGPVAVCVP